VIINKKPRTTTELINRAFIRYPQYEFYSVTNDDFIYHTIAWDETLCRKKRICYGNDLLAGNAMPTTSCIDGNIVRALGWLQMPKLKYICGDSVWKLLGQYIGILNYVPGVITEHCHWSANKREIDSTSKKVNSPEIMQADNIAFRDWLHNDMRNDAKKVKNALGL
jgi:hypothetical protein